LSVIESVYHILSVYLSVYPIEIIIPHSIVEKVTIVRDDSSIPRGMRY